MKHGAALRGSCEAEYKVWTGLLSRTTNPNHKNFEDYQGRGIGVCQRWRNSYQDFLLDMGPRPTPKHTVERVDNDGDYEPGNCRWATRGEQARNRRSNVFLTHGGETHCMWDWATKLGIEFATLRSRINRGWSTEKALTAPIRIVKIK